MAAGSIGRITRITGPVVDIRFMGSSLPDILHAVEVRKDDGVYTLEVLQHLGMDEVRCIAMQPRYDRGGYRCPHFRAGGPGDAGPYDQRHRPAH